MTIILHNPASSPAADGWSVNALPDGIKKFTALAPLGSANVSVGGEKRECSSAGVSACLKILSGTLARDIEFGATGQGGYFLSGDLTPELFRDDCRFVDPTNDVRSLARYQKALSILFDPKESTVRLLSPLSVDEAARTITGTVRSEGVLKFPWRPRIRPWESNVVWRVDTNGLIEEQAQTWNVSATDALVQTFSFIAK